MQDAPDILLRTLSALVKDSEDLKGFGLTVVVGGVVVSGLLISSKTYFSMLGEALEKSFPTSGEGGISKVFADLGVPEEDEKHDINDEFLHFREAVVFSPSNPQSTIPSNPSGPGALWRVKLSSVDAVVVGAASSQG